MTEEDKWDYILELDQQYLNGGVILSEWTSFLIRDAQIAFCANANLSSILSCQAALESHLRFDYFNENETKGWGFYQLIENADIDDKLKIKLHDLRKFRNTWVHVNDPSNDNILLEKPIYHEDEIFNVAKKSIKTLLKVVYSNPFI